MFRIYPQLARSQILVILIAIAHLYISHIKVNPLDLRIEQDTLQHRQQSRPYLSVGLEDFYNYRPFALTSQILRVSSRCSLTISVRVQQPHTAQQLTILIQNYYKLLN